MRYGVVFHDMKKVWVDAVGPVHAKAKAIACRVEQGECSEGGLTPCGEPMAVEEESDPLFTPRVGVVFLWSDSSTSEFIYPASCQGITRMVDGRRERPIRYTVVVGGWGEVSTEWTCAASNWLLQASSAVAITAGVQSGDTLDGAVSYVGRTLRAMADAVEAVKAANG